MRYIYQLYKNGSLFDYGTAKQIASKYCYSLEGVYSACRNQSLINGEFEIKKVKGDLLTKYQVIYKDEIIFVGDRNEIAKKLKISIYRVYDGCWKVKGKYEIKKILS